MALSKTNAMECVSGVLAKAVKCGTHATELAEHTWRQ